MTWSAYIIFSPTARRYYVGMTQNVRCRLLEHQRGQTRATRCADDWCVVWTQECTGAEEARALEKKIKARGASRFLDAECAAGIKSNYPMRA